MTVTYTSKIATVRFQTLWKLLLRWRGSIYKVLWKDFLVFICLYYILSVTYRWILDEDQRRTFEKLSLYFDQQSELIPLAFVLGFYVTIVVNRWWAQVNECLPWPDNFCISVSTHIHGNDDHGRLMRRTVVRYMNLGWIMALSSISPVVKKRFPTLDHLVEMGVMTKNEKEIIEQIKTQSNKYYIPIIWASTLIKRARKENRLTNDYALVTMITDLCKFRSSLGSLFNYDWMSIPLVYTQVVTIAVQAFFLSALLGRQFLDPGRGIAGHTVDIYVPIFTFLQFLFYMGWLKVAESLINPFGEDDDDFETNSIIDRNLQVSYLIVDDMHSEHPTLIKDQYWDEIDFKLPYTAASEQYKAQPFLGSAAFLEVKETEQQLIMPTIDEESAVPSGQHMRIMGTLKTASDYKIGSRLKGSGAATNKSQRLSLKKQPGVKGLSHWGQQMTKSPAEEAEGAVRMYNLYASEADDTQLSADPAGAAQPSEGLQPGTAPFASKSYVADDPLWAMTKQGLSAAHHQSSIHTIYKGDNAMRAEAPRPSGRHNTSNNAMAAALPTAVWPTPGEVLVSDATEYDSRQPHHELAAPVDLSPQLVRQQPLDNITADDDTIASLPFQETDISGEGRLPVKRRSKALQRLRSLFKRKKSLSRDINSRNMSKDAESCSP